MSKYLITGASGYIGSMLLNKILEMGQEADVIIRNVEGFLYKNCENVKVFFSDITDKEAMIDIKGEYDYIIHCAAPTRSSYMISNPVEVIKSIVNGTEHILNLAQRCNVKSMVYLSSMEVYGQIDCPSGKRITENEMGYIDVTNIRNCYSIAKLMAENLCHSYYKEYGVPVKIARLAQTFGQGILPSDNRVFAQFARAVKDGNDIVLRTKGNSMGNYCSIDDAIAGILMILERGANGEAYNVVNEENTMTIRQMAELVAKQVAGGKIQVVYELDPANSSGYAADTNLQLSSEKLRALGWKPKVKLVEMYQKALGDVKPVMPVIL